MIVRLHLFAFCFLKTLSGIKSEDLVVYLGCFKDQTENKISGHYFKDSKLLQPKKCIMECQNLGFLYAGLKNGDECFCDNQQNIIEDRTMEADCNVPCAGDRSKMCGAKQRKSLYSVRKTIKGTYLGCYKDEENRKFKGQHFVLDSSLVGMTPANCLFLCSQYRFIYAALQSGYECYCGNQDVDEGSKVSESECNSDCTGDNLKKCGGHLRNSVFRTGYTAQVKPSSLNELHYVGCYKDDKERILNGYFYKTETMLPEICVNLCQKLSYRYAGLQVGSECYCGDTQPALSDKVEDEECQFPCIGDYSKSCGGRWRDSVYSTDIDSSDLQPQNDPDLTYKGCYKSLTMQDDDHFQDFGFILTPKICLEFCERHGERYAALSAGKKCKCLFDIPLEANLLNDNECKTKCTGDKTKICGGLEMDSLYETGISGEITIGNFVGCYSVDLHNLNKAYHFTSQSMSVGKCIVVCKYYKYLYAAINDGNQCECSDRLNGMVTSNRSCNLTCPSQLNSSCGGYEKQSIYLTGNNGSEPQIANFGVPYLGCFKDNLKYSELRLFNYDYEDQMYPQRCVNICSRLGFQFTGLLAGTQCLCGNKEPFDQFLVSNDECNTRCTGDKESICGGGRRITVYKSAVESVFSNIDIRNLYIGCYRDQVNRSLKGFYKKMDKLTPWKCFKECKEKNFLYAGLQAGSECYCSDSHPQSSQRLSEASCFSDCFGDGLRFCGGDWANTIYHTGNTGKGTYLGCYEDEKNEKLRGQYFVLDSVLDGMTPNKCFYLCSKYKFLFAGVQAGAECYCGNQELTEADRVSNSECTSKCTGDSLKSCGGNLRKSVYITGYTLQEIQSPLKGSKYLGCYVDSGRRRLDGFFFKNESLVPETCVRLCYELDYAYAGVQVGSECFCGNTIPPAVDKAEENDCQFPCIGDYARKCGGRWRNSVYFTGFNNTGLESTIDPVYKYKGCYKSTVAGDVAHHQDFGFHFTPKICIDFCKRHGLSYAALYAGTECKCLSENPSDKALLNDDQCITKCTGDKTKICGGLEMASVYETDVSGITLADYSMQYVGCFNIDSQDLMKSYYFKSEKMSVGMCITVCKYYGYFYAHLSNGNKCECGDVEVKTKISDDSCSLSSLICPGQTQNTCGGYQKQLVYKTGNIGSVAKIADFGTEYIGCFRDEVKYYELQAYNYDYEDQLYPKNCANVCSRLGFQYTGLLAGSHCLCGNKEPFSGFLVTNEECNTRCTGDKESVCGGIARVIVYKSPTQSDYDKSDIRSRYLGCYGDQGEPRSLRGYFIQMDKLTPWKCVIECKEKNYLYAGLQVGSECYCGDQHPQASKRLPQKSCYFDCFGDGLKFCGGNWANSIYHTGSTGVEAKIVDIGDKFLGCYRDQENPHQLSSFYSSFDDSLTPVLCVELCKNQGYFYAGLQHGDKCFCGDSHPIPLDLVHKYECNSKCAGDVTTLCGGNRRNLVYFTGNKDLALVDSEGLQYLGCYKDEVSQRHIKGYSQNFKELHTPMKCVTLCKSKGYLFAGLQNSSYCHCGDQYPSPSDKVDDFQCNSRCTGEISKICGGILRNTIYAIRYSGPTLSTVTKEEFQYLGCYAKKTPIHLSGKSQNFGNALTPKKCVLFCKDAGHLYCGLYFGSWCFCGDVNPLHSDKIPEGQCSSKCSGDPFKVCGGPSAFTAYITPKTNEDLLSKDKNQCITSQTTVNGGQTCSRRVIFEESFSEQLSLEKWNHIIEFADEPDFSFVVYNSVPTNSYTANSKLIIKPSVLPGHLIRHGELHLANCTAKTDLKCSKHAKSYLILPPVQSARLTTRNSFSFRYGIIEIIAKLPVGDWIVPEIWLEPKEKLYGPHYISGRVNIAMSRGNQDLSINGNDISCHQLESGVMMGVGEVIRESKLVRNSYKCWNVQFHNYTLVWTPENIMLIINGEEMKPLLPDGQESLRSYLEFSDDISSLWRFGSKIAPFDAEFYLHMGLSVGGIRSFPDDAISNGRNKPWKNKELRSMLNFWRAQKYWEPTWVGDSALEIEYIKVTSL